MDVSSTAWVCYLLESLDGKRTYVGSTNNLSRRIRQHNGLIKGGAKYTTAYKSVGWKIICFVKGFQTKSKCLSFEWHWKFYSKKEKGTPLEKRLLANKKMMEDGLALIYFDMK
jgi:structure-specific endonuclease subunit SLX1